jgi:hypothetical protein
MSVTRFPNGANFVYQPPGYQPYGFQAGPDEPTWWNGQNPLLPKADAFNVDALTHAIFKITLPLHRQPSQPSYENAGRDSPDLDSFIFAGPMDFLPAPQ